MHRRHGCGVRRLLSSRPATVVNSGILIKNNNLDQRFLSKNCKTSLLPSFLQSLAGHLSVEHCGRPLLLLRQSSTSDSRFVTKGFLRTFPSTDFQSLTESGLTVLLNVYSTEPVSICRDTNPIHKQFLLILRERNFSC